jgi:hypothetical protein
VSGHFAGPSALGATGRDLAGLRGQMECGLGEVWRDRPEKINTHCCMYFLGTSRDKNDQIGSAPLADLIHWTETTDRPCYQRVLARVVEPGPAPILGEDAILLVYNGADDKLVYRTGGRHIRSRRSPETSLAKRSANFCARGRVGENRPSSERRLCARSGRTGVPHGPLSPLLWCGRQTYRRAGGAG